MMIDENSLYVLLFLLVCVLACNAWMMAGVRNELCNIDYELCQRNLAELYKCRCEKSTTENDA